MPHSSVTIQIAPESAPSTPCWFGEVAVIAQYLRHVGVLTAIGERVRFARRRFGYYDVVDFVVVLLGYAMSGERTLEAFYESIQPFATPFMALFGRERLPHRSTLSRFLATLGQAPVETLRMVFLEDLVARPLEKEEKTGGVWDRQGTQWLVFDVDGKPPANVPCPVHLIFHRHAADWTRSVLQATQDASGVKPFGPGPLCCKPIRTNGSARFPGQRRLPRRTAAVREGHQWVCEGSISSPKPGRGQAGWAIWQWGHCCRPGRVGLRDARQGL